MTAPERPGGECRRARHEGSPGRAGLRPLRILQVSASDRAGGAERSAANLHRAYRALGHESWVAVGAKRTTDPGVLEIPNDPARNGWVRWWSAARDGRAAALSRVRGAGRVTALLRDLGEPGRWLDRYRGVEDFAFPGTARLLALPAQPPDILHCHNLHGGYFDLRELPRLAARVPTVLNLRDAWLASGHCAYSFDCDRWKRGCGACPDLTLYPAVRRDATAGNWTRKRDILARCRVFVATPSQWLMDRVRESIVAPAIAGSRVVPNGVDTSVFAPGDRAAARAELGIAPDARVLMFAANGVRTNVWKDYRALRDALAIVGRDRGAADVVLLAVGETAPPETVGAATIRFVPFQADAASLATHYRAADVYVHAARVESFGNTLLEARACGLPAVATAVGGIPEQVKGLDWEGAPGTARGFPRGEATGLLTPAGDGEALARGMMLLLGDPELRRELAATGLRDVGARFRIGVQADRFLDWYREILAT